MQNWEGKSVFNWTSIKYKQKCGVRQIVTVICVRYRAVASLTVPHFFIKFRSIFLIFPQTLLIPSFWLSEWASRPPGKALATPLVRYVQKDFEKQILIKQLLTKYHFMVLDHGPYVSGPYGPGPLVIWKNFLS